MSYCIFRIEKLKAPAKMYAAFNHNARTRPCPSADPARTKDNRMIIFPNGKPMDAIKEQIGDATIRKNALLAVEVLISASPEYFTDGGSAWVPAKVDAWVNATEKFIQKNFPNAVSVALHLDEQSPHFHIIDVPMTELKKKNGKTVRSLSADKKYGRNALIEWQTNAAASVAHLGIDRGEPKSVAKHQTLKTFYAKVEAPLVVLPEVKTPKPSPFDASAFGFLDYKAKAEAQEKHDKQLNNYNAETRNRNNTIINAYPAIEAKAKMWDMQADNHKRQNTKINRLETDLSTANARLNELRAMPLNDVIESLYGLPENKDSKPKYKTRQFDFNGTTIGVTGEVFINNATGKGGRGAIDLVMELDGCSFNQAIKILDEAYGSADAVRFVKADKLIQTFVNNAVKEPAYQPTPDVTKWKAVKNWFMEHRGMPEPLIDALHLKGLIYADSKANAVFLREKGGAFVRGTVGESNVFKRTYGAADCGTFTIGSLDGAAPNELILVEGPMDAIAAKAAFPDAKIRALGGNLVSLDKIDNEGLHVRTAFDNDAKGNSLYAKATTLWAFTEKVVLDHFKDIAEAVKSGGNWVNERWQVMTKVPQPAIGETLQETEGVEPPPTRPRPKL